MEKVKIYVSIFLKGILAGICIAIGGFLYIKARESTELIIVPAFLFSIGLILICNFGFFLYTGKICYLVDKMIAKRGHTIWHSIGSRFSWQLCRSNFYWFCFE